MATAATEYKKSRLGKLPVRVPSGVTVAFKDGVAAVKGPKGSLELKLPQFVQVTQEGDALLVTSSGPAYDAARVQGLGRALLKNVVQGCAEGFAKTLELHGVGYRAELKGRVLHMALGLSHPVVYEVPAAVSVDVPKDSKGTIIHLASADRALLGQVAAVIRSFRPPEPYGGKGVRYRGENVRRKAGKAGKK